MTVKSANIIPDQFVIASAGILTNDNNSSSSVSTKQICKEGGKLIAISVPGKNVGGQTVFHALHDKTGKGQKYKEKSF